MISLKYPDLHPPLLCHTAYCSYCLLYTSYLCLFSMSFRFFLLSASPFRPILLLCFLFSLFLSPFLRFSVSPYPSSLLPLLPFSLSVSPLLRFALSFFSASPFLRFPVSSLAPCALRLRPFLLQSLSVTPTKPFIYCLRNVKQSLYHVLFS